METRRPRSRRPAAFETRILRTVLATGLPAVLVALWLVWRGATDSIRPVTVTLVVVGAWLVGAWMVRARAVRPLQTLANLMAALREGDTSMRGRVQRSDDALGLAFYEANRLVDLVREERLAAAEATGLLRRIMEAIDVAVFGFDEKERLHLVNRTSEALFERPAEELVGRKAAELGLAGVLEGDTPRVVEIAFPARIGRWEVRHGVFRERGLPHRLVLLADLSRTLREEERLAWQSLVRVLSHEINNSLAPIRSIAESLTDRLERTGADGRVEDQRADLLRGLAVIGGRTDSLVRFMQSYAKLARLPRPTKGEVDVGAWVRRVAALETRRPVAIVPGPDLSVEADGDQLDQLLINLVKNAVDAVEETPGEGGGVEIGWERSGDHLLVHVRDDGPGVGDTENLFVPFYTTKPEGSGVGLALCRQIAEAHDGTVTLAGREDRGGCEAVVRLPVR